MFRITDLLAPAVFLGIGLCAPFLAEWLIATSTVALSAGLVVLGLIIMWRAGLVSFGQGLYFALGAYTTALTLRLTPISDALLLMLASMVVAGGVAFAVGLLIARYREIFFAMLSLALSMILYGVLVKTEVLGSTDGFNVEQWSLFGTPIVVEARLTIAFYLALGSAAIAAVLASMYLRSVAGSAAVPMRENEIRVEYLGASVRTIIHAKVVIAGALAGLGGCLTALAIGHVDPQMAFWTQSGEFVFITILAGAFSVPGAFVAAFLFQIMRTYALQVFPEGWQLILGGMLLAVILFMPSGIGILLTKAGWRRKPSATPGGATSDTAEARS